MKPASVVQDEMFPESDSGWMEIPEGKSVGFHGLPDEVDGGGMMVELAANERAVHSDFYNKFDDLFDDDDLS